MTWGKLDIGLTGRKKTFAYALGGCLLSFFLQPIAIAAPVSLIGPPRPEISSNRVFQPVRTNHTSRRSEAKENNRLLGRISSNSNAPIGSFTPSIGDPRLAAAFAQSSNNTLSSGFQFTPSSVPGHKRAVTVAVRAHILPSTGEKNGTPQSLSIAPSTAYNMGASLSWKEFTLSGDVGHVNEGPIMGGRDAFDVGLNYTHHNWSTRLQMNSARNSGERASAIGDNSNYSLDVAGSYMINHRLKISGGLRYTMQQNSHIVPSAPDIQRDGQAVYLGTSFNF
ncbi:MAG: porin [Zymomonas mobilis]|uniref:Porin-like protein n=1 Tax=Zymomonas mobilis TaxID=542 RepID=A0A542W2G3_ZYMMB|nr:porin [Zymomonas mobilis]TQL17768.1 porin-like protein [Zymomonas mobilis]